MDGTTNTDVVAVQLLLCRGMTISSRYLGVAVVAYFAVTA
jgi:hypothetical protein